MPSDPRIHPQASLDYSPELDTCPLCESVYPSDFDHICGGSFSVIPPEGPCEHGNHCSDPDCRHYSWCQSCVNLLKGAYLTRPMRQEP